VAEKVVYVRAPKRERAEKIDLNVFFDSALAAGAIAIIYFVGWPLVQKFMKGEIKLPDFANLLSNLKFPVLGSQLPRNGGAPTSGDGAGGSISGGSTVGNIKIPYKVTGKTVKMNVGAKHPNGDRYNANHKFQNYYVVGYYKTEAGSGKRLIEMKTDGPNHSGCTKGPDCEWVELDFDINSGQAYISSEYPHPTNHPAVTNGVTATKLNGTFTNKFIGFGVAAWTDPTDGFRIYEEWIDPGGPGANQWVRSLHAKNTGQIIPNPKRSLPVNRSNGSGTGLEAEIRMNNQHGTSMQGGMIYEIAP